MVLPEDELRGCRLLQRLPSGQPGVGLAAATAARRWLRRRLRVAAGAGGRPRAGRVAGQAPSATANGQRLRPRWARRRRRRSTGSGGGGLCFAAGCQLRKGGAPRGGTWPGAYPYMLGRVLPAAEGCLCAAVRSLTLRRCRRRGAERRGAVPVGGGGAQLRRRGGGGPRLLEECAL